MSSHSSAMLRFFHFKSSLIFWSWSPIKSALYILRKNTFKLFGWYPDEFPETGLIYKASWNYSKIIYILSWLPKFIWLLFEKKKCMWTYVQINGSDLLDAVVKWESIFKTLLLSLTPEDLACKLNNKLIYEMWLPNDHQ